MSDMFNYKDLKFNNRAEAERFIDEIKDIIYREPYATVADIYYIVNHEESPNYTDYMYGWDFKDVDYITYNCDYFYDTFRIIFPAARPIMHIKSTEVTELNDYQFLAARTIPKEMTAEDMERHALFGMASEIGEICSIYQKTYQGHKFDESHVLSELGDLMWFIAEYCSSRGVALETVCSNNIAKLENRYPNGFEAERSLHRDADDI